MYEQRSIMAHYLQRTLSAAQLKEQLGSIAQRIAHHNSALSQLEVEQKATKEEYERQLRAELDRNLVRFVMDGARVSMLVAEESLMAAGKNVELAIQLARSVVSASAPQPTEHPVQPPRTVQGRVPPRPASPPLPAGWTQHFDNLQNRPYYFNTLTGSSVWNRPTTPACGAAAPIPSVLPPEIHPLRNNAGYPMTMAVNGTFYCGRLLGVQEIPNSDGQCGPRDGPSCSDCHSAAWRLRREM